MRKIAILLSLAVFILTLASCGGPEADSKKMIKKIEKMTKVANAAAEDKKLDDGEIEELTKLMVEFDKFQKEVGEKYENDTVADRKFKEWEEDNKEEIEKVMKESYDAQMALYGCDGYDKLEKALQDTEE